MLEIGDTYFPNLSRYIRETSAKEDLELCVIHIQNMKFSLVSSSNAKMHRFSIQGYDIDHVLVRRVYEGIAVLMKWRLVLS